MTSFQSSQIVDEIKSQSINDTNDTSVVPSSIKLNVQKNIRSTKNYKRAMRTILNGDAITYYFDSAEFKYEQTIIPSRCTYYGMYETLLQLAKKYKTTSSTKICVLCPHYHSGYGNDTQACGGGTLIRAFDKNLSVYKCEKFSDAVSMELTEQLRLHGLPTLLSQITSSINNTKIVFTQIFSFKASECHGIPMFDTKIGTSRQGESVPTNKVGYIVWGSLQECMKTVESIQLDSNRPLTKGINGVSIISLDKAIEMAFWAFSKKSLKNVSFINHFV